MLGSVSSLMGLRAKVITSPSLLTNPQVRLAHRSLPKPRPRVKINLDGELNINTGTQSRNNRFKSHTDTRAFQMDSSFLVCFFMAPESIHTAVGYIHVMLCLVGAWLMSIRECMAAFTVADLLFPLWLLVVLYLRCCALKYVLTVRSID